MLVTELRAEEAERAAELGKLSGSGFDPRAELDRAFARLWVARLEPDGPPVGVLLAWDAADEVHVLDVAVEAEARRRGVGRSLLTTAVEHGRTRGARVVLLEVRRSNAPAIALYRSFGFEEVGVRRSYYTDNGEDALVFHLELERSAIAG
jgi:ribosomal-protein-alanine N-acetyltransferase